MRVPLVVLLLIGVTVNARSQQPESGRVPPPAGVRHEIIRGTVIGDDQRPLVGAQVVAVRAPDRASKFTNTDDAGRYAIEWSDGTGDYLMHVSLHGRKPYDARITRINGDSVLVLNATLAAVVTPQTLAAVVTSAKKPVPDRVPDFGAGVGAAERIAESVVGAIAPDEQGDLAAIAATQIGVIAAPGGGVSVLGLGAGQNTITLNGMSFAGGEIPRDVKANVRVTTSTYDPSRGWFGGAQTNVELAPGDLFGSRRGRLSLDAPATQLTDPITSGLGQRFVTVQASGVADGELVDDRFYYNLAVEGSRKVANYASLLSAGPELFERRGVAADSATRLIKLVPAGAGAQNAFSEQVTRTKGSFLGRIDHAPYDWKALAPARSSWGLTGYASLAQDHGASADVLATPSHRGESTRSTGGISADYSTYFAGDFLATLRSGLNYDGNSNDPLLALPDARVRVNSLQSSGALTSSVLSFGGSPTSNSNSQSVTWESIAEVQLYPPNAIAHRLKVTGDLRLDEYRDELRPNALGSYFYNSLSDLATQSPAIFTRNLSSPSRHGGEWNAFVAAGDVWRVTDALSLTYGARFEGNAFAARPDANPAVESLFGSRTDVSPGGVHLSPRAGFTWNSSGVTRARRLSNQFGRFSGAANGVLRGGFGEFRNLVPATLLSDALANTGLGTSTQRLTCIGSAVPATDWAGWAKGDPTPSSCANGNNGAFADQSPNVVLFDKAFTAPRSWRGNLAWSSAFAGFTYALEGIYSRNLNQISSYDLNFSDRPRFTVPEEGRLVFSAPASIVPGTGILSTVDARVNGGYGRVVQNRSDMNSTTRQLSLSVAPELPGFDRWYFSLGYTLAQTRAAQRGFDGSTFGSPVTVSTDRADLDVRHRVLLQGGYSNNGITATLFGRLQSGLPFTPVINSDVNGDGVANDRAFIFDPSKASDAALATNLRALIAAAPSHARECLVRQLGQPAARNSCEGPWTATLNARVTATGDKLRLGKRVDIALNFANPLAGLDQLLHGSENARGWGVLAQPDPVLYTVRGFDPAAQRFQYTVNSRFGSTQNSVATVRAPFRVTLDVSVDVGRSVPEQQLDKWLRPGRGGRAGPLLSAAELKRRYARNVPDPYGSLMMQADSLLLTRDQVTALQSARSRYRAHMDSLWDNLAAHLASLPDDYSPGEALARANAAIDEGWEYTRLNVQETLKAILTPVQLPLLPFPARMFFNAHEKILTRMFSQTG